MVSIRSTLASLIGRSIIGRGEEVRNRRVARHLAAALLVAACARQSDAGWLIERVTRTEVKPGPAAKVVLLISKGRVKEVI